MAVVRDQHLDELLLEVTRSPGVDSPRVRTLLQTVDVNLASLWAYKHGVAGCLRTTLKAVGVAPDEIPDNLKNGLEGSVRDHMRTLGDLEWVQSIFRREELPWLVIKGPVLADVIYNQRGLRSYGDLDLLVPRHRFRSALGALEEAGAEVIDQNWTMLLEQRRAQLHLRLRLGTVGDLHWHLLNHSRDRHPIDIERLFERSRNVQVGELEVPTLGATDTFLHLALHAAVSGGHRLVWLKDVDQATRDPELDWEVATSRASAWNVENQVSLILDRCRRLLGSPVPSGVFNPKRGALRAITRRAANGASLQFPDGRPDLSQMLMRTEGAPIMAKIRFLWNLLAKRKRQAASGGRHPILVPSGGAESKGRYLDQIEASKASTL